MKYQEFGIKGLVLAADVLATSQSTIAVASSGLIGPASGAEGQDSDTKKTGVASSPVAAATDAQALQTARIWAKETARDLEQTLRPDLAILIGKGIGVVEIVGSYAWIRSPYEIQEAVEGGGSLSGTAVLGKQGAFLLAAVPVKSGGQVVGTIILAKSLKYYFETYSLDSDEDEEKRHRLALIIGKDIVTSSIDDTLNSTMSQAIVNKRMESEGSSVVPVMTMQGKDYDLNDEFSINLVNTGEDASSARLAIMRLRASFDDRVWTNLLPVIIVALGGAVVALILSLFLARTITRPVREFTRTIEGLTASEADLTQRIQVTGDDELAELATAINRLFEKLSALVNDIRESSLRLGQSSHEISRVAQKTLEGAEGQVTRIQSSTSLTNELSRTIQEIASRSSQGAQIAALGRDSVVKTEEAMTGILQTVHGSWEQVHRLKESVEKIGAIAELISKITEENSMLALNASIEAARAGAAGQGFTVVAQQMREQARRVEKSSREIMDNIRSIQSITQKLVLSQEGAKTEVDQGSKLMNVALHHLSDLSAIMQETAEAVKEQATASDEIAQTMQEIQRIAIAALEASSQTVKEGTDITGKASDLANLVGRFHTSSVRPNETMRIAEHSSVAQPGGFPGDLPLNNRLD